MIDDFKMQNGNIVKNPVFNLNGMLIDKPDFNDNNLYASHIANNWYKEILKLTYWFSLKPEYFNNEDSKYIEQWMTIKMSSPCDIFEIVCILGVLTVDDFKVNKKIINIPIIGDDGKLYDKDTCNKKDLYLSYKVNDWYKQISELNQIKLSGDRYVLTNTAADGIDYIEYGFGYNRSHVYSGYYFLGRVRFQN